MCSSPKNQRSSRVRHRIWWWLVTAIAKIKPKMKGSFFFYNHKSSSTNIKQGPPPSKNQSWGWSRFSNFSLEKFLIDIYSVIIIIIIIIIIINLGSTVLMIFCFLCIWVWTLQKTNTNLEKKWRKRSEQPINKPRK